MPTPGSAAGTSCLHTLPSATCTASSSFYFDFEITSGPTLSPVAALCGACFPSHRGKVPLFQHLRSGGGEGGAGGH